MNAASTEQPTSPYPGDPDRSQARCPDHGNPLHWDGTHWLCKRCRPNTGGRPVDHERVVWGRPAPRRSAISKDRPLSPIYYQRLHEDQEEAIAEILKAGHAKNKNDAVRVLVDAGLARRRASRRTR